MATINSNSLAVYALDSALTSPLEVVTSTAVTAVTDATLSALGLAIGDYFICINAAGDFLGIGERAAAAANATDATSSLSLVALATSSSLETQVSINETAARNGSGGSTNYIASGAMSWTISVDGLLDVSGGAGSAVTLMDAAKAKNYMIAKFEVDEGGAQTYYAGQTVISSINISGGVDDIATYSTSLQGYGELYKGA